MTDVVGGTRLQLMCCALPKCLCPYFTSGGKGRDWSEVVRGRSEVLVLETGKKGLSWRGQ